MCAGTAPSYCPVAVTRYLLETLRYEARNTVHEKHKRQSLRQRVGNWGVSCTDVWRMDMRQTAHA